ncbi:MAG: M50 family metallopeptidase [Pseudomonadota bacterium]
MINRATARGVAAIIGFIGSLTLLSSLNLVGFALIFLAPTIVILIHELGHAFAAWRFKMVVRKIVVGPFALHLTPLRFRLEDKMLGDDLGGYVAYDEGLGRWLNWKIHSWIAAAGPLANLLTGAACYVFGRLQGDDWAARIAVGFAFVSFAAFLLSAWPHKLRSGRPNDALEIIRDIKSARPARRRAQPVRSPWQSR